MVASALSFIPQEYHADILAGVSTVDVAPYLNTGLNQAKLLALPDFGQMSIGSSVFVPSGGGLIGTDFGCTIKALPDLGNRPLIRNANASPASVVARDRNILLERIRLDGNRSNNGAASEYSHGVQLFAVEGARVDVWVSGAKGDGVRIQQSFANPSVGSSLVTGKVRTEDCWRHGVAISSGDQIDLDVYDRGGFRTSVNIQPDVQQNFIRNVFIRLLSISTGNASDLSGGVCVVGDGTGSTPTNITVDFEIFDSRGQGVLWNDTKGLILRGTIDNPRLNGLVGLPGGVSGSSVFFDSIRVFSPGGAGLVAREVQGATYDGELVVEEADLIGAQIENARGGILQLTVRNSSQQGIYLSNTNSMTFPSMTARGNAGSNVWLRNGSSGNRFQFLKSVGSTYGWGFLEDSGCEDNRAFYSQVSNNGAGNVLTHGTKSSVHLEP